MTLFRNCFPHLNLVSTFTPNPATARSNQGSQNFDGRWYFCLRAQSPRVDPRPLGCPTHAKPLCTPISGNSVNIAKYVGGRAWRTSVRRHCEQNHGQEKSPGRVTTNVSANYLQRGTKHTLENQGGLSICTTQFASLCGIIRAHTKQSFFQLSSQRGAKLLVICQLTISTLEVLRRHRIPQATYPHAWTRVNTISSKSSKKNSTATRIHHISLIDRR